MCYRRDLWEIAATQHGIFNISEAEDAGVPAVEVRKLAHRGALKGYGNGVYYHRDIPATDETEIATAVALAGENAFLQHESALNLYGVGQLNPHLIHVGSTRRVRRTLPQWVTLQDRQKVPEEDRTQHKGIACTTLKRTLADMRNKLPHYRWQELVEEATKRGLLDNQEAQDLKGLPA